MKRLFLIMGILLLVTQIIAAEDLNVKVNIDIANLITELKESIESGKEIAPAIMQKVMTLYQARMKIQKNWAIGTLIVGAASLVLVFLLAFFQDEWFYLGWWALSIPLLITAIVLFADRALILQKMAVFPEGFLIQKIMGLL